MATTTLPSEPQVTSSLEEIMELERTYLLQSYARYPLALHRGKGCYVYDVDGKRYLDLISGIGVNSLGHAHPRISTITSTRVAWPNVSLKSVGLHAASSATPEPKRWKARSR
jgi:acetylornithine/succinyldiaminopimelate/putrescine aminotransferase